MGWIRTQTGDPSQSHARLKADIKLTSELSGVKTSTNQIFNHKNFEAPIKEAVHQ